MVKKVEIKGNERISLETIVIFGDIAIDKDYESSDINLLIKKLYETTFFSNISVELENNKLTIIVEENTVGIEWKFYKISLFSNNASCWHT